MRKLINNKDMIGAIFIDLTKAFDTIWHRVMLKKLYKYGIEGIEYFTVNNSKN